MVWLPYSFIHFLFSDFTFSNLILFIFLGS
jgi:hypothetical protein